MIKKILLFCFILHSTPALFAFTEGAEKVDPLKGGEKIEKPKTGEQADRLEDRYEKSKDEVEEAKKRLDENKTKLKDPNLAGDEKLALTDKIIDDKELISTYDQAGKILDDPEVQKKINEYKEQLKKDVEKGKVTISADQIPNKLQEAFKTNDRVALIQLTAAFDKGINLDAIGKELTQAKDMDKKLEILNKAQKQIDDIGKLIEDEIAKKEEITQKYRNVLNEFKNIIDSKAEGLNEQELGIEIETITIPIPEEEIQLIEKELAETKKITDKILTEIEKNEKNIEPAKRFFSDVDTLNKNAGRLLNDISLIIKGELLDETVYESYKKRVEAMLKSINDLEGKFSDPKIQLNKAYTNLQQFNADLIFEAKRYRGESPTLYQKELSAYTEELNQEKFKKPFTTRKKSFGPNELYEALGLTQEKLGFDPQKNPEKITLQQIKDADVAQRDAAREKKIEESTYEFQAARNAYATLGSTTGKALYDAFLKDFNKLKEQKFDPLNPNDEAQEWLNKQGELSQIEISKELHDRILGDLGEKVQEKMIEVALMQDISPLSKQFAQTKKNLQDALSRAENALKAQQPEGPPQ